MHYVCIYKKYMRAWIFKKESSEAQNLGQNYLYNINYACMLSFTNTNIIYNNNVYEKIIQRYMIIAHLHATENKRVSAR